MATTQTYGFKSLNSTKTPFSTLRKPAGVSPLSSLYGASMQNPVSDVLSSASPFHTTKPTAASSASTFGGYGGLAPDDRGATSDTIGSPGGAPKIPAPKASLPGINDLTADPLLSWTQNIGAQNVQDATSAALANAKGAIITSGLSNVPDTLKSLFASDPSSPILGALTDTNTLEAARQNPDSYLAQLAKQHPLAQSGIDAQASADNTFYGSRHSEALANEANQLRQAQQGVYGDLGSTLSSILQSVLQAKQGASDQYLNQLPGAYGRVLDSGAGPVVDPAANNGPAGPDNVAPPASYIGADAPAKKKPSLLAGLIGGGGAANRMI